jgi:predicted membrane-bound mannosyltransferase
VAIAALEPHFALRLLQAAGQEPSAIAQIMQSSMHETIAKWVALHSCSQLENIAHTLDIPLHTLK